MSPCLSSRRMREADGVQSGSSTFPQPGSSGGDGSNRWSLNERLNYGSVCRAGGEPALLLSWQIEFYINERTGSLHSSPLSVVRGRQSPLLVFD